MASLTASLRLNFSANTGPLAVAMRSLRTLRQEAAGFFKQGRDPSTGQFLPSGAQKVGASIFGPSKDAFRTAAHIGQAATAMQAFKAQLDGVTRGPIEDFAAFERAMANVKGKTDGLTNGSFVQLTRSARDIGRTTRFTALEAAEGYGELAAAGLSAAQQLGALPPVMKLTVAGGLALGQTTNIALATMQQFGLAVSDLPAISDTLVAGFNASAIELGDLAESLGYVGPIAKAAGLDLKSTTGFVALLGNAGIIGSRAGTALNATLARMANITPRSAKALQQLGISQKEIQGALKDPVKFFGRMNAAMDAKGFDPAKRLSALVRIFGQEAAPAVAEMLAKASNVDPKTGKTGFDLIRDAMNGAAGATDRFAKSVEDTTEHKLKIFDAQMQDLKITLGESFAPVLVDLNKSMAPVLKDFGGWIRENPRLVSTLGRVALGTGALLAVLGPLALAMSSVVTVWGVLGPAFRLGILPIKGAGMALTALRTQMLLTNTAMGTAGAAMVGAAGLVGAAFAGWKVGQFLDEAIGKMLALRGGLLSTEAALSGGESQGFNSAMLNVAETFGIDSLRDVAKGNIATTEIRDNMTREAKAREERAAKPPPAEVAIAVQVTDERTIVQSKTKRTPAAAPRVGSNVP